MTRVVESVGLGLLAGALVLAGVSPLRAEQQQAKGCASIAAAIEESGGSASADEIAEQLGTNVETVRGCWKVWEESKKAGAPKTGEGAAQPGH